MSGDPNSNGTVSKPEDFRAANRKTLALPNGLTIQVRKLTGLDFLELGHFPLVAGNRKATAEEFRKHLETDPKAQLQQLRLILTKGVVSPRVVDTQPSETPSDALSIYDIGDINEIVQAILEWSGLTEETARAAGKFSEKSLVPNSR